MTELPEPGARPDTSPPAAPPPAPSSGRSASLVALGILLSRIAGLLRERFFAQFLGTSLFASAFRSALRMPNVLQNLLGEGTLSASFIPVYADLLERGETKSAGRLAGAVFALLLTLAGAISLVGVLLTPQLVAVLFPGFEGEIREVTIRCVRIMFPMSAVLVLSAWALGILNSHRRFLVSYAAPVLWNVAIIATLFLFGGRIADVDLVVAASWGALIGGVLQFLVQLPWVLRLERSIRIGRNLWTPQVKTVARNAGPAILGRGVVQLSTYIDLVLGSFLFTGAIATLGYAQTLYVLPVSLFGMALAAAELPEMSREGRARSDALRTRLDTALRRVAVLVVPSTVAYIVLGDVVVGALYQTGEFGRLDTMIVWLVLAGYSVGLLASTSTRLYSSAFYAVHDTRTPAKIAAIRVALSAALGGGLMLWAERYALAEPIAIVANTGVTESIRPLGAAGLALGSGIAAWVEWALLRRSIHRHIGDLDARRGTVVKLFAAAAVPALALRILVPVLPPLHPIQVALIVLPVYGTAYFAIASLAGIEEARALVVQIVARFRKS